MPQHEKFTTTTDLPQRIEGGTPSPVAENPESVSGGPPADVKQYGVFHGDSPKKNVKISGSEGFYSGGGVSGGPPAEVQKEFKRLP